MLRNRQRRPTGSPANDDVPLPVPTLDDTMRTAGEGGWLSRSGMQHRPHPLGVDRLAEEVALSLATAMQLEKR